jgi:hypothetical protein
MGIPSPMHHVESLDPTRGYSHEPTPLAGRALLAGTFASAVALADVLQLADRAATDAVSVRR